ncbi:MAG: penicillin-insensitive murein endopeptidase [Myxococcales bacterium]|nr:penicillin-insensitive murein endopeptidase [Myxococcales bacterium]
MHTVERGETLVAIASERGVRLGEILRDNPGLEPDAIREGQSLLVCVPRPHRHRARAAKICDKRSPLHRHEVVPGEWLAEIASRYGVRKRDLLRLNADLRSNPDLLRTGQMIRVCPDIAPRERVKLRHTVQRGETFVSIAKRYDLNPRQLLRFQEGRLRNPDRLRLGQVLVVWKDGGIVSGFGSGERGTGLLTGGIQLPSSHHYTLKNPRLAWGTPLTIRLLQRATASYRRNNRGAPTVHIGDLSRRHGGRFPPHKSHRTGEDVDVGYIHSGRHAGLPRFIRATKDNLDVRRTWALVRSFLRTGHVRYIFMDYRVQRWLYEYAKRHGTPQGTLDELFQYPRGRGRAYGIIREDPGHDDHFHVRFQ